MSVHSLIKLNNHRLISVNILLITLEWPSQCINKQAEVGVGQSILDAVTLVRSGSASRLVDRHETDTNELNIFYVR